MRIAKSFTSHGDRCAAWLYLPEGDAAPPVVVMAHGFGGQRWMRLPAYAERFAKQGMAVFLFDYRGFNDSGGEPRNYINPARHLEDWEAAVAYVRTLTEVDGNRMALWGTSFSGGHVIVTAAKDPAIRAVVAQVPFVDGIAAAFHYEVPFIAKSLFHALWDGVVALAGRRHNVRIAGRPHEKFALISRPDSWDGLMNMLQITDPAEFERHNFCPADIALHLTFYRPIAHAAKVACPALVIAAEKDSLFPPEGPIRAAERIPRASVITRPMGHFDPYVGELFEELVTVQGDFLRPHLGLMP